MWVYLLHHICEKEYASTCICENGKYLASIMDDWLITCDKVVEPYDDEIKTIPTNFNKKYTCKTQSFYILLGCLSITIALLITVNIYRYLIKYRKNILLSFHDIKN